MSVISIDNGIALHIGDGFSSKDHAFPALGLIFSYDVPYEIIYDQKHISTYAAVIPPNLIHKFKGIAGQHYTIFLDIDFKLAQELIKFFKLGKDVIPLDRLDFQIQAEEVFNFAFFERAFGISYVNIPRANMDERIASAIEFIHTNVSDEKISIKMIADYVHLSESRFANLFKQNVSIPFRKYILWYRMRLAGKAYINGSNLTNAAYQAGFSDSAHFSKTFRMMFGIAPSHIL